jgi:hypothetical protein
MKVFIRERLNILANLPSTGTYEENVIKRDLRQKLDLSQDEIEAVSFESVIQQDGQVSCKWNALLDKGKEVEFTRAELALLNRYGILPDLPAFLEEYERLVLNKKKAE